MPLRFFLAVQIIPSSAEENIPKIRKMRKEPKYILYKERKRALCFITGRIHIAYVCLGFIAQFSKTWTFCVFFLSKV